MIDDEHTEEHNPAAQKTKHFNLTLKFECVCVCVCTFNLERALVAVQL